MIIARIESASRGISVQSKLCPNLDRSPLPNIISSEIKASLYYNQYISYIHSGGGGGLCGGGMKS